MTDIKTIAADIAKELPPIWAQVFLHRVVQSGDCMLWSGAHTVAGYGHLSYQKRHQLAHRLSFELATGRQIPVGTVVMHSCDVPGCINPKHLRAGSPKDNTADMVKKRRHGAVTSPASIVRGSRHKWHGSNCDRYGSGSPSAKITWDIARQIRADHASGLGYWKLSKKYSLARSAVASVCRNESWPIEKDPGRTVADVIELCERVATAQRHGEGV